MERGKIARACWLWSVTNRFLIDWGFSISVFEVIPGESPGSVLEVIPGESP
ncbi:hypothetical protein ALP33_200128 [Pseudomonas amygdali pv. lachrymans]|uniref:Uncharacterized protein n=1 Tax=Pseudomonas amygdali pv. lachrymans TaxID=53707 RepID=A0AB37R7Y8_PSEAV|nr:hypothetical protein ALP33_200128 [Pseudomonas amygdali pv. lachrymans]